MKDWCYSLRNAGIENIPPTQDALDQQVLRVGYEAGHVWGQAMIKAPHIPRDGGRLRRGASPGWRMGEPFLRGGAPDNTEEGAADQNYPG